MLQSTNLEVQSYTALIISSSRYSTNVPLNFLRFKVQYVMVETIVENFLLQSHQMHKNMPYLICNFLRTYSYLQHLLIYDTVFLADKVSITTDKATVKTDRASHIEELILIKSRERKIVFHRTGIKI